MLLSPFHNVGHVLTQDGLQGYTLTVNISYVILLMTMRSISYESTFKYNPLILNLYVKIYKIIILSQRLRSLHLGLCAALKKEKEYGFG